MTAHPAAQHFPGAVPSEAPRVRRIFEFDGMRPGWLSTGLYAAPGETITVRLLSHKRLPWDWMLRIGAHKDRLWRQAEWRRAPDVTREFSLAAKRIRAASAFGGLVYIVVPEGAAPDPVKLEISGVVEAPFFELGKTDAAEWRATIRKRSAPWAELAASKVIITVPSTVVRDLDDPAALMTWWDGVLDACGDLAAHATGRERPERFVADEQISVGYMHAGYPIMTHLDAAPRFVDRTRLGTQGDWGMFHELGHNHQHRDWTFAGTVEVTCNLFSLYLMETVCGKGKGHPAMSAESIEKHRREHRTAGSKFATWKTKPFTALIAYHEMKEAFGWEAYKRVFAEYRDLPDAERPKNDAQKRDQWLVRFSRTVGRNLGPYFESWGIPTSKTARDAVADLPEWQP